MTYAKNVEPVLKSYCVSCHGGAKPKSGLALDKLVPDFAKHGDVWQSVVERLADGSMPPKGKLRPNAGEVAGLTRWVNDGLASFQAKKAAAEGRTRLRRLNRVEYSNTMRNLFGVELDLSSLLPEDGSSSGFDNVDEALDLSSVLLERYLDAADATLDEFFVKGARPITVKKHFEMTKLSNEKVQARTRFGPTTLVRDSDIVFQSNSFPPKTIDEARATITGKYRMRISAFAVRNQGRPMTFLVYGSLNKLGAKSWLANVCEVEEDRPTVVEFTSRFEARERLRIDPIELNRFGQARPDYKGPGLAVQWVEMEGPLIEAWPPRGLTRLLNGVDLAKGTVEDARTILRAFLPRAFRRPVAADEIEPFVKLVSAGLKKGYTFEAALRVGLKAVVCSPDFLYLSAPPGRLNDFDLASRLAYFLWNTNPDDTLLALAAKGKLGDRDVLRQQVERMLADPRAHEFTVNFTGQWLGLRNLNATIPDKKLYPEFDPLLEWSSVEETHGFFEEILKNDRSLLEFVDSRWSMLNRRLAEHYGIVGVMGQHLHKVELPPGSHRGGVMTQASVLRVTANGTSTSPVVRGVWVLDRILGTPPPPPPKEVPAVEPDIRGATTIREQLAKHRSIESCAVCHKRIDPPGYALENFDAIGGWRDHYRIPSTTGKDKIIVRVQGGKAQLGRGLKVDPADELPGGHKFADIDGMKRLFLKNPDQIARGLTEKLLVYSTGHKLEVADRATVAKIIAEIRPNNYGFRSLVHAVVQSPTFRSK